MDADDAVDAVRDGTAALAAMAGGPATAAKRWPQPQRRVSSGTANRHRGQRMPSGDARRAPPGAALNLEASAVVSRVAGYRRGRIRRWAIMRRFGCPPRRSACAPSRSASGRRRSCAASSSRSRAGARLGLIGPAAAGKSVLLKLLRPRAARRRRDLDRRRGRQRAREVELGPVRQRIGMLFQNYALFDFLTVGDNVAFPLVQRGGVSRRARSRRRVADRLRAVGLAGSERQAHRASCRAA